MPISSLVAAAPSAAIQGLRQGHPQGLAQNDPGPLPRDRQGDILLPAARDNPRRLGCRGSVRVEVDAGEGGDGGEEEGEGWQNGGAGTHPHMTHTTKKRHTRGKRTQHFKDNT